MHVLLILKSQEKLKIITVGTRVIVLYLQGRISGKRFFDKLSFSLAVVNTGLTDLILLRACWKYIKRFQRRISMRTYFFHFVRTC